MKSLLKQLLFVAIMIFPGRLLLAQQFENFYKATDAGMLLTQNNKQATYILKDAAILLPNGSSQLSVRIPLPDSLLRIAFTADNKPASLMMNLTFDINRNTIQDNLTSSKSFVVRGNLLLNNISRPVEVIYIPMQSGSEEQGNFNVFITLQFDPAAFNLVPPSLTSHCVISINDAVVNRI
ncbi:MAG: hypothetical protein QM802_20955 [Agriterribacter sp.]